MVTEVDSVTEKEGFGIQAYIYDVDIEETMHFAFSRWETG